MKVQSVAKLAVPVALVAGVQMFSLPALADCLDDAAQFHHVNVVLVRAIAQQESAMRANAINVNTDGSEDIGLMPINRNLGICYCASDDHGRHT